MNERLRLRRLELGGGRVEGGPPWRLVLPPVEAGYGDAQLSDYEGGRRAYPWRPGVGLRLRARFSHSSDGLLGTAGFGFWNAPFGDPSVRLPALPQAAWFFYGGPRVDLPVAPAGPGRGWFASTLDAGRGRALAWAPWAPLVVVGNRWAGFRRRVWPRVQRALGVSYRQLDGALLTGWHEYYLAWRHDGCTFVVDGETVLETGQTPRGPLGFVCWVDNQYLALRPTGRVAWGVAATRETQWLEIDGLAFEPG